MSAGIVPVPDWQWPEQCRKRGVTRWYGLPGAFRVGSVTYCPLSLAESAFLHDGWERTLLVHEQRHKEGLNNHPNNPVGAIIEAVKYGFDERSFSRWFRWRRGEGYEHMERTVMADLRLVFFA